MTLQKSMGRAIRQARERKGLTQAALAEAVGLTEQYIGIVERGERALSLGRLADICAALATTPRALFPHALEADKDDNIAAVIALMDALAPEDRRRIRGIVEAAVKR